MPAPTPSPPPIDVAPGVPALRREMPRVANAAALAAVDTSVYASDKARIAEVSGLNSFFYFAPGSTATPDGTPVIQPDVGAGRWLLLTNGDALVNEGAGIRVTGTGTVTVINRLVEGLAGGQTVIGGTAPGDPLVLTGSVGGGPVNVTGVAGGVSLSVLTGALRVAKTPASAPTAFGDLLSAAGTSSSQQVEVGSTTGGSTVRVGQDATHNLGLNWEYNATAALASASLNTFGYANRIDIDASVVRIQRLTGFNTEIGGLVDVSSLQAGGIVMANVTTGRLAIATAGTHYSAPIAEGAGIRLSGTNPITVTNRLVEGLAGGQTVIGDTASGGALLLRGTSHASLGRTFVYGRLGIAANNYISFEDSAGAPADFWRMGAESTPAGATVVTTAALVTEVYGLSATIGWMLRATTGTSLMEVVGSTGVVRLTAAGSAGAPTLSITDAGVGLYRAGSGVLGLSGTRTFVNGRLGIAESQKLSWGDLTGSTTDNWYMSAVATPSGATLVTTAALVMEVYGGTAASGFMMRSTAGTSLFEVQGSNGVVAIPNLAGAGSGIVVASSTGLLSRGVDPATFVTGPAGSDGQLQYNNGGVFGGAAYASWNDTTSQLELLNIGVSQTKLLLGNAVANEKYEIGRFDANGYFYIYGQQTGAAGFVFSTVDGEYLRATSAGTLVTATAGASTLALRTTGNHTDHTTPVFMIESTAALGQLPVHLKINGTNRGGFRVDYAGTLNWWATADHIFYVVSDPGTQVFRLSSSGADVATLAAGGIVNAAVTTGRLGITTLGAGLSYSAPTLSVVSASTTVVGIVELATTTEQLTGTDATRASTPDSVAALWEDGGNNSDGATVTLGEGGSFNLITSTTTITQFAFATDKAGRKARLRFNTVRTLLYTPTVQDLPTAANIVTAVGDICELESRGGGNFRVNWYTRASGAALAGGGAAGATGDVQYNGGSGSFAAEAAFNYDAANNQLAVPGLTVSEDVIYTGIVSPAQITADQTLYTVTGIETASVVRINSSANWFIASLAGTGAGGNPVAGQDVTLINVGSFPIVWFDSSVGSGTAACRILFVEGGAGTKNFVQHPGKALHLRYDSTSSRWRAIGWTDTDDFGGTIASATTTDLTTVHGRFLSISGTTTITSLGAYAANGYSVLKIVIFTGILTLTHNATSLILPGAANITTAVGDVAMFNTTSNGSWRCLNYTRADGTPIFVPGAAGNVLYSTGTGGMAAEAAFSYTAASNLLTLGGPGPGLTALNLNSGNIEFDASALQGVYKTTSGDMDVGLVHAGSLFLKTGNTTRLALSSSGADFASLTAGGFVQANVTTGRLAIVSETASTLIGRGSAGGSGTPEQISIGSNLVMSGTTLSAVVPGESGFFVSYVSATIDGDSWYLGPNIALDSTDISYVLPDQDSTTQVYGVYIHDNSGTAGHTWTMRLNHGAGSTTIMTRTVGDTGAFNTTTGITITGQTEPWSISLSANSGSVTLRMTVFVRFIP